MKEVVYTEQVLLQFEESVTKLVEQRYFGDEDYAVDYMRDIFRYFALNLQNSVSVEAPEHFNRYSNCFMFATVKTHIPLGMLFMKN